MKTVIFDLDNTLYDAKQYFSGAFKQISTYLSKKYDVSQDKIYNGLMELWKEKTSMYPYLFNDLLSTYEIENELQNIVKMFNSYDGEIVPYEDAISTIKTLKEKKCKLGIITNGDVIKQKRKITSLKFENLFDKIIYTKEIGCPKPLPDSFNKALVELSSDPKESFYVGDNPLIDFEGAKKNGMITVRLLRGEFQNIPSDSSVDYEIQSLHDLIGIVNV